MAPPTPIHPNVETLGGAVTLSGAGVAVLPLEKRGTPEHLACRAAAVVAAETLEEDCRHGPPHHGQLPAPRPAMPRLRRLFDPKSGWFRRLERNLGNFLTPHVYPWIPGIDLPYGVILERQLTVSEAEVRLANLPAGFDGVRVLLVTDLHAGPFLSVRSLRRVFQRLSVLRPDLILLGGDLASSRVSELVPHLPDFRTLTAPLGVFAVLGNHDHYTGEPRRLVALLEQHGVRVLQNASVRLERMGGSIDLAGIDDLYQGQPDLDAALAGTAAGPRTGAPDGTTARDLPRPVLLLSHNPDIFFEASRRGVALVLSGHTHGGQIRIPAIGLIVRQSRYRLDQGRYAINGAELVVSRGLGASGLPLRLACSPEAVLLTLRPL